MKDFDTDELNRLVGQGIPAHVAMDIMSGELDEAFELERWAERREVCVWMKKPDRRTQIFVPIWDCDPARYYLVLDGKKPSEVQSSNWIVVDVEMTDIRKHLQFGSDRNEGPWSPDYEDKTAGIAYRWSRQDGVTPPLIHPRDQTIVIGGGMHRFHLAAHYDVADLPVLVDVGELDAVRGILKSARPRRQPE